MNIFKIFIPKNNAQTVEELESFTISWQVKTGWSDSVKTQHKVFIKKDDAKEFQNQLEESAKFIGCWIRTELKQN